MAKEMKYRDISKKLTAAGATVLRSPRGSHVVWACCASHSIAIPSHTVSPGVVRAVVNTLQCLPKGAIQ
jgi:predicted RNA binding protein YcfA (HicA-like mRNA interferase family)